MQETYCGYEGLHRLHLAQPRAAAIPPDGRLS
jgi:hypothetical protein